MPSRVRHFAMAAAGTAAITAAALATSPGAQATTMTTATHVPKVSHVWVIDLENQSFADTFGNPKTDPYLAKTLVSKGALLDNYYGIGHDSLDNYIAQVSGQAPNFQTGADCGVYTPFTPLGGETFSGFTKDGQLSGDGCVYPSNVKTIGNQLDAAGKTWKDYDEDMGNVPSRDGTVETTAGPACGHPALGAEDLTDDLTPRNDSYATRHNPFMYFESVIGNQAYCDTHVVSFKPLAQDLAKASTTPDFSFVVPNTCHDAHDDPCQDGEKGGLGQVDRFLQTWIPRITSSPAYKQGGEIVITFDESDEDTNAAACCGEKDSLGYDDPSHPNTNEPGLFGPGGGRVGAIVISKFVKPGTVSKVNYNHYSLLRSLEQLFHLSYLGDANQRGVAAFGSDIYRS